MKERIIQVAKRKKERKKERNYIICNGKVRKKEIEKKKR